MSSRSLTCANLFGLPPQQYLFCVEYSIDHNGRQAALRANYAESGATVQASRLLKKDKVQKALSHLRDKVEQKMVAGSVAKKFLPIRYTVVTKI